MDALVILGPTASGKTALAVSVARTLEADVVSVDSRQVYRGLDIGSGKDRSSYGEVPVHLLDIAEPGTEYSLFDFVRDARAVADDLDRRHRLPIYAGGTGLYLDALLRGYEMVDAPRNEALRLEWANCSHDELVERLRELKALHNETDTVDRARTMRALEIAHAEQSGTARRLKLSLDPLVIGLELPPDVLKQRIRERLKIRLEEGMIEEVQGLLDQGVPSSWLDLIGLEYRYINRYLSGQINRNDMFQKLMSEIVRFARQQRKWFRRMERQGVRIHWLDARQDTAALCEEVLALWTGAGEGKSFRASAEGESHDLASTGEVRDDSHLGTSFEPLIPRFRKNIYGSLKGRVRLAILEEDLGREAFAHWKQGAPCRVLDAGCGSAPLSRDWAVAGHRVELVDLSGGMLELARESLLEAGVPEERFGLHEGPLQRVLPDLAGPFDVILLHAVLEWVPSPRELLEQVLNRLSERGVMSLTFYNLNGFLYRRLLQGNFRNLDAPRPRPHLGDLTPIYPLAPEEVMQWAGESGFRVTHQRGLRCFVDYMHPQAAANPYEALLEQERVFSMKEPFRSVSRYLHWVIER